MTSLPFRSATQSKKSKSTQHCCSFLQKRSCSSATGASRNEGEEQSKEDHRGEGRRGEVERKGTQRSGKERREKKNTEERSR